MLDKIGKVSCYGDSKIMLVDKVLAIEEAGRIWRSTVGEIPGLKKRIREEAEAQIEVEIERRRTIAARAIHEAWMAGATKVSLRRVTTKDHWDFESYIDLGKKLAREERA